MTRWVESLVGIYNAKGSLMGELQYVVGKMLGSAHCALCDISHRGVGEKAEFRACRSEIPVPFEVVHLDERPADLMGLTQGKTPCVVARGEDEAYILLDAAQLETCGGDVAAFRRLLDDVMAQRGLVFRESGL